MTDKELDEWGIDFLRFCARFADVFGRKEPRVNFHLLMYQEF